MADREDVDHYFGSPLFASREDEEEAGRSVEEEHDWVWDEPPMVLGLCEAGHHMRLLSAWRRRDDGMVVGRCRSCVREQGPPT